MTQACIVLSAAAGVSVLVTAIGAGGRQC